VQCVSSCSGGLACMHCVPCLHRKKTVFASHFAMGRSWLLSQIPCMQRSGMDTYVASIPLFIGITRTSCMIVLPFYSLALSCLLSCPYIFSSSRSRRRHFVARTRWAIPEFNTTDVFYAPVKDALKSVATLFETLCWMEAERGDPPPLAVFRPRASREDVNMAMVKAFFAQSSLGIEKVSGWVVCSRSGYPEH
jgi:hypothetical protein